MHAEFLESILIKKAYQALTGISGRVTRQYIENGRVVGYASRFTAAGSAAS